MTTSNTYEKQESEHENDFLKCSILKTPHIIIIFWQTKNNAIITFTNFYKKSSRIVNIMSRSFKTSTQKEVAGFCDK